MNFNCHEENTIQLDRPVVDIPPVRPIDWVYKELKHSKVELITLSDGQLQFNITPEVCRNVTPEMALFWFKTFDQNMILNGVLYPRYHVWHPRDHIKTAILNKGYNGTQPGSIWHIQEVLGRNPDHILDGKALIKKIDTSGYEGVFLDDSGKEVGLLNATFIKVADGSVISGEFILPPQLPKEMTQALIKHCVEEIGNLEYFLPELYQKYNA